MEYRSGPRISRRKLLCALPAIALAPRLVAGAIQTSPPGLGVERLLGFGIRVPDVARSVDFYQELFGMPVQARSGGSVWLRLGDGPQFMSVHPTVAGEPARIAHICLSTPGFEVDRLVGTLGELGIERIDPPAPGPASMDHAMKSWVVRTDGRAPELYFGDAFGLVIQLQDPAYCGGSGALGEVCDGVEAVPPGQIALRDLSHFTVFGSGAGPFYEEAMGFAPQAYQATTPALGVGDGIQFLMFAGGGGRGRGGAPAAAATIHHASFNMNGFVVEDLTARLSGHGLTPDTRDSGPLVHYVSLRMPERGGAEGGTPELYFTDPDGLLMQIQDSSYCGGGGLLGDICV
jgi:catechol 2,3-dioxygenase-like lactoylglutathione lyase family enzyme